MMEREFNEDEINELAQILNSVDDSNYSNPRSSSDYNDADGDRIIGSSGPRSKRKMKSNNNTNNTFDSDSTSICEDDVGTASTEYDNDSNDDSEDDADSLEEILYNLAMEELEESRSNQQQLMKFNVNNSSWGEFAGRQKEFGFVGHCGLQDGIKVRAQITAMETFNMLVDNKVVQHIVTETNRFAQQMATANKTKKWQPTNLAEMRIFFGLVMWTNIVRIEKLSTYWSDQGIFRQLVPSSKMSLQRFESLLRMIHFSHDTASDIRVLQLGMIQPFIKLLQTRFQEVFCPGEQILVQESFIPWTGHLKRSRHHLIIPRNKSHQYGLISFKLCSSDGYTWAIQLYSGKSERGERESFRFARNLICNELAASLLDAGRTLYVDNFCTSYELAKQLLHHRTHLVAMLSPNNSKNFKNNIPKEVLLEKLNPDELIAREEDSGVVVVKWNGGVRGETKILSTKHPPSLVSSGKEMMPAAVLDFNRAIRRTDRLTEQICSPQHVTTLKKLDTDLQWYQKMGLELICGTALVNAWIVYQHVNNKSISIQTFRKNVTTELLQLQNQHLPGSGLSNPASSSSAITTSNNSSTPAINPGTVLLLPMAAAASTQSTAPSSSANSGRTPLGLRIGNSNSNSQNMPPEQKPFLVMKSGGANHRSVTPTVSLMSSDETSGGGGAGVKSCPYLVNNLKFKGLVQLGNFIDEQRLSCDQVNHYLDEIVEILDKKHQMPLHSSEKKILRSVAKSCDHSLPLPRLFTSAPHLQTPSGSTLPDLNTLPFFPDPNGIYGQIKPFRIYLFPLDEFQINQFNFDLNSVAEKLFALFQEFFLLGIPPKYLKMVLACLLYKFPFLDDKSECGTEKLCEKVKNKYRYKANKQNHHALNRSEDDIKLVAEFEK